MPLNIAATKPIYVDLDPNLTRSSKTGDVLTIKDNRSVALSIKNLLATAFGERLFRPNIGACLRPLLFEPVDGITALELQERILKTLQDHEPRISNVYVDVVSKPDQNSYSVTVEYSIRPLGQIEKVDIILERVR